MKINGSAMIARAESREKLIEELKKDIYTTAGIWDWDKVNRNLKARTLCYVY